MVPVGICFGELRRLRDSLGARANSVFPKKKRKRGVTWNLVMSQPTIENYLMYSTLRYPGMYCRDLLYLAPNIGFSGVLVWTKLLRSSDLRSPEKVLLL